MSPPRPMMMAMRAEMAGAAEPPVAPGELEVRASVTLTAAIEVGPARSRLPQRLAASREPTGAPWVRPHDDAVDRLVVEQADEFRRAERRAASGRSAPAPGSSSGAVMPLSFSRRAVTSTRRLERSDGAGCRRRPTCVRPRATFSKCSAMTADAVVELAAELADLLRVLRDLLLLPSVGDRAQQRDQRRAGSPA